MVAEAEKQARILNALQAVLDPEIGISVIDLDLIRDVSFTPEEAEIKMVLTTPFCPYGPMLTNQIQSVSEQAAEMSVKVRGAARQVGSAAPAALMDMSAIIAVRTRWR